MREDMIEQTQETNVVEIDGKLWDAETGELLRTLGKGPEWAPTTLEDFEWLGERLSALDGELAGVESRRKFLNDNLDAMAREVQRRKDGLLWKFRPLIEAHAKANLPKGKRTWVCPFMSVAFRSVAGGVRVRKDKESQARAFDYCKANFPHTIKTTEELKVSLLTDDDEKKIVERMAVAEERPEAGDIGFDLVLDHETVTIKTTS